MEENKKYLGNKIILVVLCVLCTLMMAVNLISGFGGGLHPIHLMKAFMLLLIMYYAIFAYKKPHGNVMKYIFLGLAFLGLLQIPFAGKAGADIVSATYIIAQVCTIISTLLIAYVSGRLDRIKENKIIFLVVLGLALVVCILTALVGDPVIAESAVPIDGVPIDGVPVDGVPIDGVPVDGVPIDAGSASTFSKIIISISKVSLLVNYAVMMAAYLCRYQLHKEAGMLDKQKKNNQ